MSDAERSSGGRRRRILVRLLFNLVMIPWTVVVIVADRDTYFFDLGAFLALVVIVINGWLVLDWYMRRHGV